MLCLVLPEARRLGIDRAFLTCDVSNIASMRVIEKNGGILESTSGGELRYWVHT